jgi:hypothetical protein
MEIEIEALLPHARTVAITMPSTSPTAHPVSQCAVARTAERLSDSEGLVPYSATLFI